MAQTLLKAVADFSTQLAGTIEVGAESAQITSVTDKDGVSLVNDRLYGFTVDTGTRKEYFIGRLTVATRTLSQIVSISRQGVATPGFARKHRIGTLVQITDWALLSRIANVLDGTTPLDAGTPLRYDGAPAQSEPNAMATVQFVLDTASGGAVTFNRQIIGGTAGVTVAAQNMVYLDTNDGKWRLTKADVLARSIGVKIGIAMGSGTADAGISGGVQVSGTETVGSYTPGARYYLSDTAGALSTTPGTNEVLIGIGDANGDLLMLPNPSILTKEQLDALAGGGDLGTPDADNKFLTEETLPTEIFKSPTQQIFTSSGTYTPPAGLKYAVVEVQGGGGSGASTGCGSGGCFSAAGGGGGYARKRIAASALGGTETVTVGAAGGTSSFGSHCSATGGGGGSGTNNGGNGGVGSGGDVNIPGGAGGGGGTQLSSAVAHGGSSVLGNGGGGRSPTGAAGGLYGGGGGGGGATSGNTAGGGAGAAGIVIVTEYYV